MMHMFRNYVRDLTQAICSNWNRFWFTPADPATIGLLRILAGGMILYTHAVWTLDLNAFFGPQAWLNRKVVSLAQRDGFQWSHLWLCESPAVLWTVHGLALGVCLLFMLGLWSRVTSILTCLVTLSYAQRAPEAMFGLDQINGFLAIYLALAPSGDAYSLDRWLLTRRRRSRETADALGPRGPQSHDFGYGPLPPAPPSISANIATRLIQIQMCMLYLFAGLSKLQGEAWWNGTALWGAVANLEYQSLDMLWLVHHPWLVNLLTHVTIVWEISYSALIWHRLTRPLVLAVAIPVHLGIGFCLGMITFGSVMLIANLAFVSPALVRSLINRRTTTPQSGHAALQGPKWLAANAPRASQLKSCTTRGRV